MGAIAFFGGIVPYSGISFSVFGTLKVYIKEAQARCFESANLPDTGHKKTSRAGAAKKQVI